MAVAADMIMSKFLVNSPTFHLLQQVHTQPQIQILLQLVVLELHQMGLLQLLSCHLLAALPFTLLLLHGIKNHNIKFLHGIKNLSIKISQRKMMLVNPELLHLLSFQSVHLLQLVTVPERKNALLSMEICVPPVGNTACILFDPRKERNI